MSVDSRARSGYHGRMPDDDSQTARGDELDSTVLSSHFVGLGAPSPIRLSIPGELHFEILGTPTAARLAQYARLIESLIVIAEFAAEQRSKT